jgi:hypothetical protein
MFYILSILTIALFAVLGLVSTAQGAGPAALKPIQDALRPIAPSLAGVAGALGVVAVVWGVYSVIDFVVTIQGIGYRPLMQIINLIGAFVLIAVGILAGYSGVAAFFGAPVSGAGRLIDKVKTSLGPNESVVGLVALGFAVWTLIAFILILSRVSF